ncbi:MAG: AraC family transcriptional regulator [Clostridia bacterium]|nr:AraC family transcriptional regulator [Clostridia bacterium]
MREKIYNFCGYEKILTRSNAIYHMDMTRMLCPELHSHSDNFEVFYVKFGECTIETNTISYRLHINEMLIIPPSTPHRMRAVSEDAVVGCLPFRLVENEKMDEFIAMVSPCVKISASPLLVSLWDYTRMNGPNTEYYKERDELIDKLVFAEIVTLTIQKAEATTRYQNTKIKSYLDIIDNFFSNPANYNRSAQELADSMHISVRHLNRLLIQHLGDNFGGLIRARRLILAQWMLRNTKTSIDEIYEKIGYTSKSAFFKIFKESTGMTPKQYRDAILKFKKSKGEEE